MQRSIGFFISVLREESLGVMRKNRGGMRCVRWRKCLVDDWRRGESAGHSRVHHIPHWKPTKQDRHCQGVCWRRGTAARTPPPTTYSQNSSRTLTRSFQMLPHHIPCEHLAGTGLRRNTARKRMAALQAPELSRPPASYLKATRGIRDRKESRPRHADRVLDFSSLRRDEKQQRGIAAPRLCNGPDSAP